MALDRTLGNRQGGGGKTEEEEKVRNTKPLSNAIRKKEGVSRGHSTILQGKSPDGSGSEWKRRE